MGANRNENSSYAAVMKKIKSVKQKVVVDRVHPLKNVNQSRSKAEVELSAVEVGLPTVEFKLSAAEVGPSAAGAELSAGEVVLSAAEVELLLLSWFPRLDQKSRHLRKSSCVFQNWELLKLHNPPLWQPVNLLQQRPLMPLPQVHPKQYVSQNPGTLHLRDCSQLYLLWWRYIDQRI